MRNLRFPATVLLVTWLLPGGLAGQTTSSPGITGLELTPAVQLSLKSLSDRAVEWHQAFQAGNRERTEGLTQEMLAGADALGMQRLPDIAMAAMARAVQAAEDGDYARASWALEAAEELDPQRPETSFARAHVQRLQGSFLGAVSSDFSGYVRMFQLSWERGLWFHNLVLWALYTLLVGGALYIAVLIGVRGGKMVTGLAESLGRLLPRAVVYVLLAVLLVAPLLLPHGLLWFLLLWSVLLWGYGSISERVTLALLWLALGVVPFIVAQERQSVVVELSPPMRALNNIGQGRMYGSLFTDLAVLRAVLPDSPALNHLVADLHRRLGQWQIARSIYAQILDREPDNPGAQINIGVYYFNREDYGRAQRYFQAAALADPASAVAFFNLSQAYNAAYLYDDAAQALGSAQQMDANSVSRWIAEGEGEQVRAVDEGVSRLPELRRQLRITSLAGTGQETSSLEWLRRGLSFLLAVGLFLSAGALHLARRGASRADSPEDLETEGSTTDLLLRVFIPGLKSSRAGKGPLAYLATLPPVGLLLIPLVPRWGYRIPWGYDPGGAVGLEIAVLGLLILLVVRLLRQRQVE